MVIPLKRKAFILFLLLLVLTPIAHADYRDPYLEISKGNVPGHLAIHKYGHNLALDTNYGTSWGGSTIYTYPTVATLMNLTSTDVDDTNGGVGAWNVTIYGLDAGFEESSLGGGGFAHIEYAPARSIPARSDIEFQGIIDVVTGTTEINYYLILVKDGYKIISDTEVTGDWNVLWLPIIILSVLTLALIGRRR